MTRKYSIIIPSYNEEKDIAKTIDSLLHLDWDNYEIIIVDDSTDNTPQILRTYTDPRIQLVFPSKKEGRCGARNIGINLAEGQVVVILNADVILPSTFIFSIDQHYQRNADVVMGISKVINTKSPYARYVDCLSQYHDSSKDSKTIYWTEGYSCKRELAINAGLFPSGYPIPLCSGEDAVFGRKVAELSHKVIYDEHLVCHHYAPSTLSEYWYIRKGRGAGSPLMRYFYYKISIFIIVLIAIIRAISTFLAIATFIVPLYRSFQLARYSKKGYIDIPIFCWTWSIEKIAFCYGELTSIKQITQLNP